MLKQLKIITLSGICSVALVNSALADSFSDALANTYKNNPRIKSQREALKATDERVPQALSGWLPNVSAGYQKGRQKNTYDDHRNAPSSTRSDEEIRSLSLQQPLFNGGETIANTSSAKNQVLSGREDLRNVEQALLQEAATAYLDVVRDEAVLELSKNNEIVLKKQLDASNERFAVGEVTRTDVAQSEARSSNAATSTIQAKGNLEASRAHFERVVGYKPEKLVMPKDFPAVPATLEEVQNIALKENPNLKSADFRQKSSEDQTDATIAKILPNASLVGSMRRQDGAGVRGVDEFDTDSLLVDFRIPLYQSGAEYSRVRAAKQIASQRKFELSTQRDVTKENVSRAWEGLQTAIASIKSTKDAIKAAEIAVEGVKQEQLYGSRTVLDVLDAEQELFASKVSLVRAEHDRAVAIFNLLGTMGRMNLPNLGIKAEIYDPKENYDSVKYQFIGF